MKLSCPSCSAKYSIADEKVQDRLAKIRCRKCSATIIIDGKVDPPNVYTSDGQHSTHSDSAQSPADSGSEVGPGEYSVDFGDNDQRTMTIGQIVAAYNGGEVSADTYVWTDGMGDWQPLGEVPEINAALHAAAHEPAAAPAAPDVFAAPPAVAMEPPRAAARTGSGRGSAHDLFGSIETAGSEEDVTTSAPQPPPVAPPGPTATGARNESSVLFSLSALTATAGKPASTLTSPSTSGSSLSSTSSAADDDDSGLIDLKALTSASGSDMPASPLTVATAPLGLAAPLGGIPATPTTTDVGDYPQRQSGSKMGLMIGGGLAVMGVLIAGAILATSGGAKDEEGGTAAAAVAAEPMRQAAAPVDEEPEQKKEAKADSEEVTAKPPATGTAAEEEEAPKLDEAAKAATPTKRVSRATYKPRATKKPSSTGSSSSGSGSGSTESSSSKSSGSSSSSDSPKKTTTKKKKGKTCNCAPSDLMCAMKCAAG